MATTPTLSTRATLAATIAGLVTGTYVASAIYPCNTNKPWDVVVEVQVATTNALTGTSNFVFVFVQESLDGTNFRSGPTSGTTTTDEPNLRLLGSVPLNTASTTEMGTFSVAQALGYLPYAFKVVIKNSSGVTLTSGGVFTSEISG